MTTAIILFAAILIGFNIWNIINLNSIKKRPLRNDSLNDAKYWELKYKMQYMITVFAIILFVAGYLGFTTLSNVKENVRTEFQISMDSLNRRVDSFKLRLSDYTSAARNQFERVDSIQRILQLLDIKQKAVSTFISGTYKSAQEVDARVKELMNNDQIRQNIYVIDDVPFKFPSGDVIAERGVEYQKYYFKNFKTVNGNPLPNFIKPPYIIGLSKESSDLRVTNVSTETFDLMVYSYTGLRDMTKPFLVTLIVVENK